MSLAYYDRVDAVRHGRVGHGWRWSERENRRLRALYSRSPWRDLRAALPGRSKQAIEQHAQKLSVSRICDAKPAWTGTEIKTLRRLFEVATWDELERALPRHSRSGIRGQGFLLKLRRPSRSKRQARYAIIRELRRIRRDQRQTMVGLAELIGVHKSRVQFWEIGQSVPRLPALLDWAQALGCELVLRPRGGGR